MSDKLKPDGKSVGDLAVWRIANPPNEASLYVVKSPDEAIRMINALASLDLENSDIECNAYGLVEWDGAEWLEWYSPHGDDIEEYELDMEEAIK